MKAYAPVLDFSVPQIAQVARRVTNNPAAYERFMSRAAAQKGLYYFSLGDLLYWQGQYDASLDYYRKIEERYDRPGVITDWWADYRGRTNDGRYDSEVEKRMKALFPRGVEKVTLASFQKRPDEGVLIDGENERTQAAGQSGGTFRRGKKRRAGPRARRRPGARSQVFAADSTSCTSASVSPYNR